jgi:hypothetical protein
MNSPIGLLLGRINGVSKRDITRRTVPCYKYVLEQDGGQDGEQLRVCLLVDSKYLYRWPYENLKGTKSLAMKASCLKGEMEHLRLREFQPGICRYVHPQGKQATA